MRHGPTNRRLVYGVGPDDDQGGEVSWHEQQRHVQQSGPRAPPIGARAHGPQQRGAPMTSWWARAPSVCGSRRRQPTTSVLVGWRLRSGPPGLGKKTRKPKRKRKKRSSQGDVEGVAGSSGSCRGDPSWSAEGPGTRDRPLTQGRPHGDLVPPASPAEIEL